MVDLRPFLNTLVTVTVDRPLGGVHPRHPHIVYPLNYGFVAGTLGGDGAPVDAYVLGVNEACAAFTGRVVAIVHRLDDDDDKLIVTPDGEAPSDEDIVETTWFMEQFFESEIWR